jgi:hypothetical protein
VYVSAHFDNGFWMTCQANTDPNLAQVAFCYDSSPPYFEGFPALLTGESVADCKPCTVRVDEELRAWLAERGSALEDEPAVSFVAQQGSHVLMRAEGATGQEDIVCLFSGLSPVVLESCAEVAP